MTRLMFGLIYYIFYTIEYLFPVMMLFIIDGVLNINFLQHLERFGSLKQIIDLVLVAYAVVLPSYRAKLASDAYVNTNISFWEAHTISGVILKTHLSFLPIIGFIFKKEKKGK